MDGRNRHRASVAAGVDCPMTTYSGGDPVGFVVSLNLRRRHLSEGQRAWVASRISSLGHGQKKADTPIGGTSDATRLASDYTLGLQGEAGASARNFFQRAGIVANRPRRSEPGPTLQFSSRNPFELLYRHEMYKSHSREPFFSIPRGSCQ